MLKNLPVLLLFYSFSSLAGSGYLPPDTAGPGDVRITEIMADPVPAVGLPEAEYIELYNASDKTFNLADWKYSDATASAGIFPAQLLLPGEYIILCRANDTLELKPFGRVIGLKTFPALNDGGDDVEIFDNTSQLIDKVNYTNNWYRDENKASGGWSLELIDLQNACGSANNWMASTAAIGGTPGKENSVKASNPDNLPPVLQHAQAKTNNVVLLQFNEKLDSALSVQPSFYQVSPNIPVTSVAVIGPEYTTVELTLAGALQTGQLYRITVTDVRDCSGNRLTNLEQTSLVLPENAQAGDVVINEVLFNPRSGGVDFVELVNRSQKYISLQNWQIGNIKPDSAMDARIITAGPFLLAPQQYVVLTPRPDVVQQQYLKSKPEAFLKVNSMPGFPDDAGTVVIIDAGNQEIDRFAYHEDMHFRLIGDVNGVSLERIRLDGPSTSGNFHSGATSAGYATPGYRNSQGQETVNTTRAFTIEPKVFTPDGDGDQDFTTINYTADKNGLVANITVYDTGGRLIRQLVKNELLASQGFFQWDGTDNQHRKAPVGYYVLFIQLFNLQGRVETYKETVVVGAKF
jgi:hypothetical protein